MVSKARATAAQLARVKADAQASAVAEGRAHVLEEAAEHEALRAQRPLTEAASAKVRAREARLRKAGLLQSTVITEAEIEAEGKK
jgi:hypothetical protein